MPNTPCKDLWTAADDVKFCFVIFYLDTYQRFEGVTSSSKIIIMIISMTTFIVLSSWLRAIARVHLMNAD